MDRKLLSLPVTYGGMDVIIFCDIAENQYNSRAVTASLIKLQLKQITIYNVNKEEIKMLKTNLRNYDKIHNN